MEKAFMKKARALQFLPGSNSLVCTPTKLRCDRMYVSKGLCQQCCGGQLVYSGQENSKKANAIDTIE